MDLSDFDTMPLAEAGAEIPLKDLRTGRNTDVVVVVIGQDSDLFAKLSVERARRIRQAGERNPTGEASAEDIMAATVDLLAGCTKGWRNMTLEGAAFEYSEANARTLYKRFPPVREQINQAIADRVNFLPARKSA